jgi:hypothetical protein
MGSPLVPPPVVKPKALFCPNCGGQVEKRGFGHTITIVCSRCATVLDASTPLIRVIQTVEEKYRKTPLIPLGSRGAFGGASWEAIGYQTRGVESDGVLYEWEEYLLFNPYRGFRYLTQYNGHWNLVTPLQPVPETRTFLNKIAATYNGRSYKHFSHANADTTFVLGEFPWRVRAGDRVAADDLVSPPYLLSREATKDEVTWSEGVYTPGAEIWKAFALPGSPPQARGVYLNQPSPYAGKVKSIWAFCAVMLLLWLFIMGGFAIVSRGETVLTESHRFSSSDQGEASFVTKEFQFTGRPAPVEVKVDTNLDNNWAYFNFALINEDTGEAYDFGREVSYYHGTDSDGSWTEGSTSDKVTIAAVPPGKYYLRVEPEMDTGTAPNLSGSFRTAFANSVNYQLTVRHGAPVYLWFLIAGALLLIPPVIYTIRAGKFEAARWSESDYVSTSSSSDDD